jgi:hypothetical protein
MAIADFAQLFAYAVMGRTNVVVRGLIDPDVFGDEGVIERCASALEVMATHEDPRLSRDLLHAGFFEGMDHEQLRAVTERIGPAAKAAFERAPPDGFVPTPRAP